MAPAIDRIAVMTENLTDAGLDEKGIAECLQMLDSVHSYNDRIDCLDYFIYTLKNLWR